MSNIVIPDGGTIGSASDTDAIQISASGNVTLSQTLDGNIDVQNHTLTTSSSQKQAIVDGATITSNDVFQGMALFEGSSSSPITATTSFNVSGITRNAAGRYRISWDTDFLNTNYYILETAGRFSAGVNRNVTVEAVATTHCDLCIRNFDDQALDTINHITVVAFTN